MVIKGFMIYRLLGFRVLGFRHLRAEFMGFGIQTS